MAFEIDDFIGVYENVVTPDYCERIITHYNYMKEFNKTVSRQASDNAPAINKETDTYFFVSEEDPLIIPTNIDLLRPFMDATWISYSRYVQKYGVVTSLEKHGISNSIKIQKTNPSGGYHVWHSEHGAKFAGNRLMMVILYLNDVEEGGETEFLYQRKRVKPKTGTMVICPASYTHTHRGNPPLTGDKYIMNTWIEFV
jgi:hypothetical protein